MLEKFSTQSQRVISIAEALAFELNHPTVGSEHLLLSFLKCQDNILAKELKKADIDYLFFREKVEKLYTEEENNIYVQYTFELKEILTQAIRMSEKNKEAVVSIETLAICLINNKNVASEILMKEGVNLTGVSKMINNSKKKKSELNSIVDLHLMGSDNKDPLVGRKQELRQLINALSRRNKPNAILVGEPGVGKSAIVEELAKLLLENKVPSLKNKMIYELDIASTVSGTKYRGEFEEKIKKIIKKVQDDSNAILFIDEIHTVVKAGGAEGAIDASNILKPYLSRGEIQLIGATTEEEFNSSFEKDKALKRRFQIIRVEETSEEETLNILKAIKPIYEKYYKIKVDDYLLNDIVLKSNKYLVNQKFPDKAIDLLDNSCVIAKNHLSQDNINSTLKDYYNVSISFNRIDCLKEELNTMLIGQDLAIKNILNEFKIIESSPKNLDQPIGVFLFNGPSGCGKSLCAKTIGKCYFSSQHTITLNMNSYRDVNGLNRLINSSSSNYLETVSPLVKGLTNCPNSLVIIEDIDHSSNEVKDFFYDVFDRGYFYDNRGNKVNCANAMFIMTSSIESNAYSSFKSNLTAREKFKDNSVSKKLGESFISRVNAVIEFENLTSKNIKDIMGRYLTLNDIEFEVAIVDDAYLLSEENEYSKSGARLAYKNIKKKLFEKESIKNI